MKTTRLLLWCAIAYGILLNLIRGSFPPESSPSLFLVGVPLIVIAVIIARDLSRRSTGPTVLPTIPSLSGPKEDPVRFLSGQISVAAAASDSYFENVIRARLKELLISKVAIETGMERNETRRALSDPREGPKLLEHKELYMILYGPTPKTGPDRMDMIEEAIQMIGEWKA